VKKRLAAFAGTVRRMVRLRPLAVTLAMMMIHIASKETTLAGTIDRLIQFAMAYALVAWAMKPNSAICLTGTRPGAKRP
jgi:hypothetical protein